MKRSRLIGAGGAITAIGALTIGVVGQWEGLRLHAYQDVVGVWTACYGETKGIRPGMKFTQGQCDTMFMGSLTEHEAGMRRCLAAPDALPEKTYVSFVSVTYNIGVGGRCRRPWRGRPCPKRLLAMRPANPRACPSVSSSASGSWSRPWSV